jgi:hypothetical protein
MVLLSYRVVMGSGLWVTPSATSRVAETFFIFQTNQEDLRWVLNGHTISRVGSILPWTPKAGIHALALCEGKNEIIESD